MISGPFRWMKWTRLSAATARASSVLPVPGGPYSSTPFGGEDAEPLEDARVLQRQLDDLAHPRQLALEPADVLVGDGRRLRPSVCSPSTTRSRCADR